MPRRRLIVVALALAGSIVSGAAAQTETRPATSREAEFFEKQVRPILAANCLECHGAKKQEFGLRLDSREGLFKGSDGGPVVVPGKPDESSLVEAVGYGGGVKMPPKRKLSDREIAALTEWVRLGAPWPAASAPASTSIADAARTHWAFQPLRRPPVPDARAVWSRNPIDRFLLAKLEANGLDFSPEADRRTLLRRVWFDLVGLPPSPDEAADFLADDRPDAYERLVDRLLASPQHGERWGRYWLDVSRYADTKGYVFFEDVKFPWAWTYRDYVVRALNEDLPYDRFVREQLAADLLELDGDPRPLAALGFLTNGGRFMNNQHDILDDRIDVVGRGLLGLTIGCARCHDHKFDPIPAADYYSLYGVFRSASEPVVPPLAVRPPDTVEYRRFEVELSVRRGRLDAFVNRKFDELVAGGRSRAAEYLLKAHAARNQPSTEEFMVITDKGDLNPTMIVRWQKYLEETRKSQHGAWVAWHLFADAADPTQTTGGAAGTVPFAERAAAALAELARRTDAGQPINRLVSEAFVGRPAPQSMADVAQRYGRLLADVDRAWLDIPASAESDRAGAVPSATRLSDDAAEELRLALYGPDAPANLPRLLGWGFLSLLPDRASQEEFKKLLKDMETHLASGPGAPPRAMALVDNSVPFEPRVFLRGNPNRPGALVSRQAPAIADPNRRPFEKGSGRLELAEALVDRDNPLTARVMANRLWMHHFGQGLVTTAGDFGLRSDPPSHPELLDWLAADLRGSAERGMGSTDSQGVPTNDDASSSTPSTPWSLKRMHRLIVLSAAYRQQSGPARASNPQSNRSDPENRLLWRQNRRRLEFEPLRDALLAVSGALDATLGGPSVAILGGFNPRRTIYGTIDRQDLPPVYRDFDVPDPSASSPQRESTTVPPQALFLMNGPFAMEAANRLANRPDVQSQPSREAKLERIARILYARPLSDRERSVAEAYLGDAPDASRWQRFVHALLLTNEFAFMD